MDFFQELWGWSYNFFTALHWQNVLDLVLVSFIFYQLFSFAKKTKSFQLINGFLLFFISFIIYTSILYIISNILKFPILVSLLQYTTLLIVVSIPIILQSELRRIFFQLGLVLSPLQSERLESKNLFGVINTLINTVQEMSENCIGALIVIERQVELNKHLESGYLINGEISKELLLTIFHEGTPMHDGAVILRGNRIIAAGVVLPLVETLKSPSGIYWGTRHRAALGISEESDAVCLVVSEETGSISLIERGKIHRNLGEETLERRLLEIYQTPNNSEQKQPPQTRWHWLPLYRFKPKPETPPKTRPP